MALMHPMYNHLGRSPKKKKRKTRYSSGVQSKNKVMESVSMKKKLKTTVTNILIYVIIKK